jgi:L-alanine-DL-glutamate epimerase-like enolase superfamily enzyme
MSAHIRRVDVYTYDLRYAHGRYVMSGGREITTLVSTVVRVTTEDGVTGYGEACPLGPAYLPGFAGGVMATLRELAPQLIGLDASNLGVLNATMDAALSGHGYAKSAVDVACWDAWGRTVGQPVATLLGGIRQRIFPLYVAVPLDTTEAMVAHVQARRAEGLRRFQLKLGADPVADARRVAAVVEGTSDGDIIVADANCGWRLQDATIAVRLMDRLPRVYLEQPCPTLEECLMIRRLTSLPMILDEVITDVHSLVRAYSAGGLDGVNAKISRLGGLSKARLVRDVAVTMGLRLTIEDTWGGDITTAVVSHLAASTAPEALFTTSFMNDWTDGHVAGYSPRSQGGFGSVPDGVGLGIEVDDEALGPPAFSVASPGR